MICVLTELWGVTNFLIKTISIVSGISLNLDIENFERKAIFLIVRLYFINMSCDKVPLSIKLNERICYFYEYLTLGLWHTVSREVM